LAMDETNAAIARRVRARRRRLGVSLSALAQASGVDLAALSDLEDRQEGCSAADLWRIAQALGASLAELCAPPLAKPRSAASRTFRRFEPDTAAARIVLH